MVKRGNTLKSMTSSSALKWGGKTDPKQIKIKGNNKHKEQLMKIEAENNRNSKRTKLKFSESNKPEAIKNWSESERRHKLPISKWINIKGKIRYYFRSIYI